MHSYRINIGELNDENASSTYEVWFFSNKKETFIRQFPTEDEAAAYVSYLNGGADPRLTRRQLSEPRSRF